MKKLIITMILATISLNAFAMLREGSFKGYSRTNGEQRDVVFLLKHAEGRSGSFYGVIVDAEFKSVSMFLVEQRSSGQYGLVPFHLSYDGELSTDNHEPSLILTEYGNQNRVNWTITSANTGNESRNIGNITITEPTNYIRWISPLAGRFGTRVRFGEDNVLTLSHMNRREGEANAIFTSQALQGNFVLREKLNGLFALNTNHAYASGDQVDTTPRKIGIFLQKNPFLCTHHYLALVSPTDSSDVLIFQKH